MRIEFRVRTPSRLGRWAGMAQWPKLKVIRCTRRSKADADADSDRMSISSVLQGRIHVKLSLEALRVHVQYVQATLSCARHNSGSRWKPGGAGWPRNGSQQ